MSEVNLKKERMSKVDLKKEGINVVEQRNGDKVSREHIKGEQQIRGVACMLRMLILIVSLVSSLIFTYVMWRYIF